MNDEKPKESELGNSILAIIGGAAASFLTGLILYPLMQLVADHFFEFDLFGEKKGLSANDIIFWGAILTWLFVAALAGGFACSMICRAFEKSHAFILSGILLLLQLFTIGGPETSSDLWTSLLVLAVGCLGFLSGTKIGIMKKKRRKNKREMNV